MTESTYKLDTEMVIYVLKRDGLPQKLDLNRVIQRARAICSLPEDQELVKKTDLQLWQINRSLAPIKIDYMQIAQKTIAGIYPNVKTSDLDVMAANIAQSMSLSNPEYGRWASRILVSNLHKNTVYNIHTHLHHADLSLTLPNVESNLYWHTINLLYNNLDDDGVQTPLINPHFKAVTEQNYSFLVSLLDYSYDYLFDFAALRILEDTFLLKVSLLVEENTDRRKRVPVERPQHMLLREVVGILAATPHVDYKNQRYLHQNIWEEAEAILKRWIKKEKFAKLEELSGLFKDAEFDCADLANLDWKKYEKHIDDYDALEKYKDILKRNTMSWSKLLAQYKKRNLTFTTKQKAEIVKFFSSVRCMHFTHATPTLMQAGSLHAQLSSCYLMKMPDDSTAGIGRYWMNCMELSKWAGGLGGHMHSLRCQGSYIRGTNGYSNGAVPMLKVVNDISVYIDQGGNKRPGSNAPYFSDHYGDLPEVLDMAAPQGTENTRARELFFGIWMSDEYLRCLREEYNIIKRDPKADPKLWYLMCPDKCYGLNLCWDKKYRRDYISDAEIAVSNPDDFKFTRLFRAYVKVGKFKRNISARSIWNQIMELFATASKPYICFKDAANRKSNQQNLGTIGSSNLCTEIMEYSSSSETAVCNLASIRLTRFVRDSANPPSVIDPFSGGFVTSLFAERAFIHMRKNPDTKLTRKWIDWEALVNTVQMIVRNLDRVIDVNYYPITKAKRSNLRHRPMGIGVQDYAGLLSMLRIPFDSDTALRLNFYLFERIYFAALTESNKLALEKGSYETFAGSPASQGRLQMDLWTEEGHPPKYPLSLDWTTMRETVKTGLRNSLLLTLMPTATTSTLMGSSPAFEPYNGLVYKRRNKSGELIMVNTKLQEDLISLGLWNDNVVKQLLSSRIASIANIPEIPDHIKEIYPTVWDLGPKVIINHALTRGVFICQGQSLNLWMKNVTPKAITSAIFYAWKNGSKNGVYYLRQMPVADAQKIQIKECVTCSS